MVGITVNVTCYLLLLPKRFRDVQGVSAKTTLS